MSATDKALLRKIELAIWSATDSPARLLDEITRPASNLAQQQEQCRRAARAVLTALAGIES